MPIAAWTLHLTEYHADGGFRIAELHPQIQINDGAATVVCYLRHEYHNE
jgi:hypothetical protein